MKKLEKLALINDLSNWGNKELGRPRFGKECLWASSAQGVIYDFDKGYNENNELVATLRKEVEDLKSQRDKQLATKNRQISSKDQQIEHLTKLIDQQQQLQLAIVAENNQLKESMQKNKLNGTYKANQKDQSTENNYIQGKDRNDKQSKKGVSQSGDIQKEVSKNKTNKGWWRFGK